MIGDFNNYENDGVTDAELFSYIRYRFLSEKCLYEGLISSIYSALNDYSGVSNRELAQKIADRIIDKDTVHD